MNYKDQQLITQAYTLIYVENQIDKELNNLILNENIWDMVQRGREAVTGAVEGLKGFTKDVTQTASDIATLPKQLEVWSTVQIPEYIDKMGNFIMNIGWAALAGGAGIYALGKFFLNLAKKLGKEADTNYDNVLLMLPVKVQMKIKELEHLRETDEKEYDLQFFHIQKNAMIELKKNLKSKGIKVEQDILVKSLNLLGNALASKQGTIAGAILMPYLMYELGFNPLPIFPSIFPTTP